MYRNQYVINRDSDSPPPLETIGSRLKTSRVKSVYSEKIDEPDANLKIKKTPSRMNITEISKEQEQMEELFSYNQAVQQENVSKREQSKSLKIINQVLNDILELTTNKPPIEDNTPLEALLIIMTSNHKKIKYIQFLHSEICSSKSPQVIANYELLILLLKKTIPFDYTITTEQNDFKVIFNQKKLDQRHHELDILTNRMQQKEEQLVKYVNSYEKIVQQMSNTITELINKRNLRIQLTPKLRSLTFSRPSNI